MAKINRVYYLYFAWLTALAGTAGSLIMSEILGWVPCVLCWYQRIALYPLVIIIAIGILRKDKNVSHYVLPLSAIGATVAFYHWLLQIGVLKEAVTPCMFGVSCATTYFNFFGFINIPFLSLLSFLAIMIANYLYMKGVHHDN